VRANIFKIVRDEDMTDDILQEVFITLWDKREKFGSYKKIDGWLFVASYNRSMNYLRKIATEKLRITRLVPNKVYNDDPNETAFQEEQYRLLEEAICQLAPQRRKVFELCRFSGKTYDQAAQELSISKNTVKDHLAHANESIRAYIKLHGGESFYLSCFALFILDSAIP